jgi:serine/threonine-protein kinase
MLLMTLVGCGENSPQGEQTTESPQGEQTTELPQEPTSEQPSQETPQATGETQEKSESESSAKSEEGWQVVQGQGVSLSLPENYTGGNPSTEIDRIAEDLEAIGPGYGSRVEAIRQNPDAIALLAFDPKSSESGFLTNVNVTKQPVPEGVTVEQFLEAVTQQIANQFNIVNQEVVEIEPYQAGKIVAEATVGEVPVKQVFYTVKDENTFWVVAYSTTQAEFDQRLPNFEQSIRTFTASS